MSTRHLFALIAVICTTSQLGCCMMQNGRGGCGMGGQVYGGSPSCGVADCCGDCASCGCPEASCRFPEASCSCPDASCGCPGSGGCGVGCGSGVTRRCGLLSRMRKALRDCSGCSGSAYRSEWQDSPPQQCDSCDRYGNYTGGSYSSPHGRRAQMAKRNMNISNELRLGGEDSETIYR